MAAPGPRFITPHAALTKAALGLVSLSHRRPWAVLLVTLGLIVAAGWSVATNLGISTDTSAMLSEKLEFRQRHAEFIKAFPALSNDIIVVVDGQTPAIADRAAESLVKGLRIHPESVISAVDIAGLPYFRTNGLLYMDLEGLESLSDTLVRAQPFLASLWQDPTLRGLADVMDLALGDGRSSAAAKNDGGSFALAPVLEAMAEVTAATARGEPAHMAWSAVLGGEEGMRVPTRHYILVKPALNHQSLAPAGRAMTTIRNLARDLSLDASNGVRVRLTGSAVLAHEELQSVRTGMDLAGLLTLLLVSLLLAVGLRSGRLIIATTTTLVCGLVLTAGFAAAAVGTLNLISVAFAVLFIGLSVDFGIHFGLRYREGREQGLATRQALEAAALCTGAPLALSALSAAIAFLSFLPTTYLGLAQLGLISGVGMGIALVANLTILPAVLTLLPPRILSGAKASHDHAPEEVDGPLTSLVGLPAMHPKATASIALMVIVAALFVLPDARFDFDPMSLKDPNTESVSTLMDIMGDPGLDPYSIDILEPSLEAAEAMTTALKALPEVKGVASLPALVPGDQEDKLPLIEELAFVIGPALSVTPRPAPDAAEQAAARDRLTRRLAQTAQETAGPLAEAAGRFAAALANMPADTALLRALDNRLMDGLSHHLERLRDALDAGPVSPDDLPEALRQRYLTEDGRARLEVFPRDDLRDQAALERFVQAVRSVAPNATGTPVIILEAAKAVKGAFIEAGLIALLGTTLLLALVLRSVRSILLVYAPVAMAGILTAASAALMGQAFNFANLIILPLLVGLGVAGGIHIVGRARQEADVSRTLESSTPRAVVFSALTTIGSFGSIALSSHPGTASMGLLLTVSIALMLVCTLILLPALIALWPSRRG